MLIDATGKNCKGAIASLEKAMTSLVPGSAVDVVVYGLPNKIDVYAWAKRKGHTIQWEQGKEAKYRLTVIKGS